jgi:hypothetical protein
MPLGERDKLLLQLRQAMFGSSLVGLADCPQCAEPLELCVDIEDLLSRTDAGEFPPEGNAITTEGLTFRVRPPNTEDLILAGLCEGEKEARSILMERCILGAATEGTEVSLSDIPEQALATLCDSLEGRDLAGELRIDLKCPACDHTWDVVLDPASFFWSELHSHACRLLEEIDVLARAYGWGESDILELEPARRRLYVEMVTR